MSLSKIKKLLFAASGFFLPVVLWAAGDGGYQPLAPIKGYTDQSSAVGGLSGYLNTMFKLGIALASGLAVIMIIIGGIQYMSTDAVSGKSDGKDRITSAIYGLILALASYVILNTINPKLLNTKLDIEAVSAGTTAGTYGPGGVVGATGGNDGISNQYTNEDGNLITEYNNGYIGERYADGTNIVYDANGDVVNGSVINPSNLAIDTDGRTNPGIGSLTYKNETSYAPNGTFLDATTDYYVAVPSNSGIQMGTPVLITDNTTGNTLWAVAGDNGATGYGEMSLKAAQDLGLWIPGRNAIDSTHNVTFTVYNAGKH